MISQVLSPRLKGFRFPRSIISYAVWAYHRFALSLRDVEDLLAKRGVIALGSKIKIENLSDGGKKLAFTLVEGENDPDAGKIGIHTPLGEALLESQVGDVVEYQVGSHINEVRVLEIR